VQRRHISRWIVLDDSAEDFPPGCEQLILCDPRIGLDGRILERLGAWLAEAPGEQALNAKNCNGPLIPS